MTLPVALIAMTSVIYITIVLVTIRLITGFIHQYLIGIRFVRFNIMFSWVLSCLIKHKNIGNSIFAWFATLPTGVQWVLFIYLLFANIVLWILVWYCVYTQFKQLGGSEAAKEESACHCNPHLSSAAWTYKIVGLWENSPCPYLDPQAFNYIFLSPVQLRKRSDRAALVGPWHTASVNPPKQNKCKAPGDEI